MLPHSHLDIGFGAVVDLDLAVPLPDERQRELRELFARHGLLVFHDQHLTQDEQRQVMAYLELGHHLPQDPEYVSKTGDGGFVGTMPLPLHSDSAFMPEPIAAISLFAVDVADDVGVTKFANAQDAYRRLPEDLRERIDGLHTLHVMPRGITDRNRVADLPPFYPRCPRKLVHTHTLNGERGLYLSWIMLDSIIGVPDDEGDALIEELVGYLWDPAHIYEHRWRNGDLVVWDNVALVHGRDDTSAGGARTLQRASVGAHHFFDLYPEFPPVRMPHEG